MRAGSKYLPSGKFNFIALLITLTLGVVIASLLGVAYAAISEFNPFIYLNFLVLIGLFFGLSVLIRSACNFGKSRNKWINLVVGLLICLFAYYAHWCYYLVKHTDLTFFTAFFNPYLTVDFVKTFADERVISIGKSSRSIFNISGAFLIVFYVIEFLAFILPAFLNIKPMYYNEKDDKPYDFDEFYIASNGNIENELINNGQKGNFSFLETVLKYKNAASMPYETTGAVLRVELHYCEDSEALGIVNVKKGALKKDKNGNLSFDYSEDLFKDIYIDKESEKALLKTSAVDVEG